MPEVDTSSKLKSLGLPEEGLPRLGVSLVCGQIREFGTWVRAVEEAGFSAIGFGDSPAVYPETYVQATIIARETKRVMFGPRVTNPLTRHPSVTASAMSAVAELSGDRAVLGIGLGDSAVHSIGTRPASLATLKEYVETLQALFSDGHARYRGKELHCPYAVRNVPIYLAGSGQRGLALAGEIADGVIVGGGIQPEIIEMTLQSISEGAQRAGRRLEDLDIWWLMGASIAETDAEALDAIGTHLAAATNAIFRGGTEGKCVPENLVPMIESLVRQYDFSKHEIPGENFNAQLVKELGLTDYLSERFTMAGTPATFADQVARARSLGAEQLWFTMPLPNKIQFLDYMREGVFPRLRIGQA